jgi:hypothetical protein
VTGETAFHRSRTHRLWASYPPAIPSFAYGGTTINGQASKAWALAPQNDSERF